MIGFNSVLKRIIQVLDKSEAKYAVVGAIAGINYGRTRTTIDIDLIIDPSGLDINNFNSILSAQGFASDLEDIKSAINEGSHLTIFDNLSSIWLDILFTKGELETVTLDGTVDIKIANFKIKCASLETYLISKLYFMKDIVNEQKPVILEYKDVQDFMAVYILQKDNLNEKKFMELIDRFGLRKVFEIILDIIKSVRNWK